MSDIWVPPGALRFDEEVERIIEESEDPANMRSAAEALREQGFLFPGKDELANSVVPDSAVMLFAEEWARFENERGERPLLAYVKSPELERMILDGNVHYENAFMVEWTENPVMNAMCPALMVRLREFQLFTPLTQERCPAPDDWADIIMSDGFAYGIRQDGEGDRFVYMSTGPMHAAPPGLVLPPASREKVGRNEKCPCGSGIKYKKCHGA